MAVGSQRRHGDRALQAACGAQELFRLENEREEVVAWLAVGAAEFWLADESPE
jgi:hypothetical protein